MKKAQICNPGTLQPGTSLPGAGVIPTAASAPGTDPCGQLSLTNTPPLSTESVFLESKSSKKTSLPSQMSTSPLSLFHHYIYSAVPAPISQLLAFVPDWREFVEAFFIKDADHCDYFKFRTSSLKMSRGFSAVVPTPKAATQLELFSATALEGGAYHQRHIRSREELRKSIKGRISSASSMSLGNWGMTVPTNFATDDAGFPKTAQEFSLWVVTGNIQCRRIEPDRPTLQECLDTNGIAVNSFSEQPLNESFVLKANSYKAGNGNSSHPAIRVFDYSGRPHPAPNIETQKSGKRLAVMYRAPQGDRVYTEEAPTLRSLGNTDGHQAGSGAFKVVEYKGEDYLVHNELPESCSTLAARDAYIKSGHRPRRSRDLRASLLPMGYRRQRPLTATEFERLMGWPVGSTEKGVNANGSTITISKTQRQKMLGNGIVPAEIENICLRLKPFLSANIASLLDGSEIC